MSTHRRLQRPRSHALLPLGLLASYGLFWAYFTLHLPVRWVVVPIALAIVLCAVVIRRDLGAEAAARQIPTYQVYRQHQDRLKRHVQEYIQSLEDPGLSTAELDRIATQAEEEAAEAGQAPAELRRVPETWLGLITTMTVQLGWVNKSRVAAINDRAERAAIAQGRIPEDAAWADQTRGALARELTVIATKAQQLFDQRLLAEPGGNNIQTFPHHA